MKRQSRPGQRRVGRWHAMQGLGRRTRQWDEVIVPPRKEDAPCCVAKRDVLGRLPIGYCGPDCVRRPASS